MNKQTTMLNYNFAGHEIKMSRCKQMFRLIRVSLFLIFFCCMALFAENANARLDADVQQQTTITGTVSDADGDPLPGVTVMIKGTAQGTATDTNGAYSLSVPNANATLVFSFIGFTPQEIQVGSQRVINVTLSEDTHQIEEIVVVGYGTQKKANLTGSVAMITSDKLENRPIISTGQGLQGLIPNLNVTIRDGDPTTGASFNVRGYESINGGGPLILVDGMPMDINRINPNDIASVVVLKDAAASAIYGARAAFGVVMIETKQGTKGQAKVTFSTEQSWSKQIFHYNPVTDPYVFKTLYNQANIRTNGQPTYNENSVERSRIWSENPTHENAWDVVNGVLQFYGSNNYKNKLLNNSAPQQKYDMSISKATEDASYYVSFGYLNKDGYLKDKENNEQFHRYNILMKSDIKIKPWLHLDDKIIFNMENSNKPHSYGAGNEAGLQSVVRLNPVAILEFPDLPYYIEPGDREKYAQYIGMSAGSVLNLLPYLEQGGRTTYSRGDLYLTQGVTLLPMKGLKFRGDFTYHNYFRKYQDTAPEVKLVSTDLRVNDMFIISAFSTNDFIENQNNYQQDFFLNAYAEYEMTQFKDHSLKAMVGFNQEWGVYEYNRARANRILNPSITNIQATTGLQQTGGSAQHVALRGVFYRINYIYKDKYLAELNGRYDGTSRFPKDSRFGFFPSASVAWRISEESFMKGTQNWLDNLKFRLSYGAQGNQLLGSNYYPYIMSMAAGTSLYMMDGGATPLPYISAPGLVASTLTWETVVSRNIALDVTALKQRLDVSFDMYIRDTKDMLMTVTYPDILGATAPQENGADLRTKGWELSLTWRDRIGKDWRYDITLSLSDNQTEITKFFNPSGSLTTWREGQKVGEIWGYTTEGIFQTEAEVAAHADQSAFGVNWLPGDIKYADLNGDGRISAGENTFSDPGDRKVIGNTTARYSFGLFPKVSYKSWSLDVFFQGILKKDYMPSGTESWVGFYPLRAGYIDKYCLTDCWREDNRDAYFAALHNAQNNYKNTQNQSRYVQNAAFIRLKNLALSYAIPSKWTNKIGIGYSQVYLAGMNLWEYTKMRKPLDPESTDLSIRYPRQRTFSFGIKVSL